MFKNNQRQKGKWSPTDYYNKKLEEVKEQLEKELWDLDQEIVKDPIIREQGYKYCDIQTKPLTIPNLGDIIFKRTRLKRRKKVSGRLICFLILHLESRKELGFMMKLKKA